MNFLEDLNISNEVIDRIKSTYSNAELYEFTMHSNNATKIIFYLRNIGVDEDSINNLLIHNVDIFLIKCEDIKEWFAKADINEIVENINDDYLSIYDYI